MAFAWLVGLLEALVAYLGLVAYALAAGADPGGPLAGPLLVLLAALLGAALVPLLYLPAVAAAEALGRGTPAVTALSAAVAAVLGATYASGIALATDVSPASLPAVAGVAAFAVLPPVVGYALTARGVGFAARLLARRSGAAGAVAPADPA
jgi:hypothetical protein